MIIIKIINFNKYMSKGTSEAVYGLGFIGAAVYYIQHADTFLAGAMGILKAAVWPAILVYEILQFLAK